MTLKTIKVITVLITSSFILAPLPSYGAFLTGNDLFENLTRTGKSQRDYYFDGVASGYVMGVVDSTGGKRFCISGGVVVKQIEDAVRGYLTANPQFRHLPADHLVGNALSNAFPCPR